MSDEVTLPEQPPEPSPQLPGSISREQVDWLTLGFLVMFVALALVVTTLILVAYRNA